MQDVKPIEKKKRRIVVAPQRRGKGDQSSPSSCRRRKTTNWDLGKTGRHEMEVNRVAQGGSE